MSAARRMLDVRGLTIEIDTRHGPARVVDGIDLPCRQGRDARQSSASPAAARASPCCRCSGSCRNKIACIGRRRPTSTAATCLTLRKEELRKVRGGEIGFIFQDPMTSLNPVMRIGDQIAEPLIYHRSMAQGRGAPERRRAAAPCRHSRRRSAARRLSARAFGRHAPARDDRHGPCLRSRSLLIADEPTTALDVTIQAQIVELVKELRDEARHVGGLDHP